MVAFLFAHGAGAGSRHPFMEAWAQRLAGLGAVRRFDYDYMAAGRKLPDRLPRLLARHRAELMSLRGEHSGEPVVLIGKSMGSRVGCHLALEEEVAAVVCLGYPLVSGRGVLRDEGLRALRKPVLFVSGSRDPLCPLARLAEVRSAMVTTHQLHVVQGGDHGLTLRQKDCRALGTTQEASDAAAFAAVTAFVTERAAS